MYKKTVLDNGLKIVAHPMPKMQSAAIGVWIKVGGRYESSQNKGISHYMEHLAFKGSRLYSCRKIKESIEGLGGSLNGFTSEEFTCYLAKLPHRHLYTALNVLSSMVKEPLLRSSDINKERTVILEEIKMYKDLPQSYVHELLDFLLWPKQPLGMSIAGSEESVSGIHRKELSSFKEYYYVSSNMVISAAGALDYDKLVEKMKGIFCHLKAGKVEGFLKAQERQVKPQLEILDKPTEQTHLAMGFHGFKREHPLRHALNLLHIILGANMSSRLFNEVREKKGLAYEIGTAIKRFQDTGAFIVHAGIDNSKINAALAVILKELARTKKSLVTIDEFRRAKDFYLGQLSLALDDTLDHMLWIGEYVASHDKVYTLEEVIKEVNKVSRQDVCEAARYVFQEKSLNLALIGPMKRNQAKIYRQLNLSY